MKPNRALIVLTLLLALATILSACAPAPTPAPTQAPVSTEAPRPTRPPETTVPPPDLWAQIQRSGVLRVGTSADYPPFEYYDARYQLDGFDIGLIRAIGRDLGLKVEIKDYAFDGLYNALQLGSIDAAIAAITVTPDRQQYVDFSNDYYAGKGAALAAADSKLSTITDMAKLASLVVGVQTGSVYESTVQKELVATGLMPAKNVQSYPDIGQAVNDLKRNRLDVVLLDLQPAQSYANEGGVKIVGEGLKPQSYAIAIPKGAESLRRVLNQAISAIIASGEYDRLAALHLGLKPDDLEPLPPTPAPTQTPVAPAPTVAPPAGCIDDMSYVADITYDDKNMTAPPVLQPGQTFVKTWRIRNSGTCAWDSKFYLAYASGNSSLSQMGGQPTYIIGTVAPGATYDISVNLTAPTQPGVYQGFWQMNNAAGQAFGTKVYVGIQVVAPTPTPAPTQPASITFTVNQTNITAGQCVVFNWNVQNVQAVYFYAQGENPQDNGVAGQGSQTECPTQTTTYYLSVVYTNGSNTTQAITINVAPPPVGAPIIAMFTVAPPQINAGQCVGIQWEVQGSVQQVIIARNGTVLWSGAPVRGTLQDCPPGAGSMAYTLQATGPGGQNGSQRIVNVVAPSTAVPPTAVPPTAIPPTAVPPTTAPQPPAIVGKNWTLVTYNNGQGALVSPIAGTTITALFGADGKVTGSDSCNTYNAPYTVNGTALQVGLPVTTGMACPDDIASQGQLYLADLQQAQRYEVSGNQLTLFAASGQKLLQCVTQ